MLHCLYPTLHGQKTTRPSRNVNSVIYFKELTEEFIISQNYYYLFYIACCAQDMMGKTMVCRLCYYKILTKGLLIEYVFAHILEYPIYL